MCLGRYFQGDIYDKLLLDSRKGDLGIGVVLCPITIHRYHELWRVILQLTTEINLLCIDLYADGEKFSYNLVTRQA